MGQYVRFSRLQKPELAKTKSDKKPIKEITSFLETL